MCSHVIQKLVYVFLILFCWVIFVAIVMNGTKNVLSNLVAQYKNFPIMSSITITPSVGSAGDVLSGFIFWASAPHVRSGAGYG